MHGIENEAQLSGCSGCKRHGNVIVVPFSANDQLALHDITRQFGKITASGRLAEDEAGILNPATTRIKSGPAFRLVKVSRRKIRDDVAIRLGNFGKGRIVKLNDRVHV